MPTVLVILVRLRLVTATILRKQRKIAYFILFAFAEIITPVSDPIVAPLTVMVPLVILYEISIFAAFESNRVGKKVFKVNDSLTTDSVFGRIKI